MRIAIGIATRNRAPILAEVLHELRRQIHAPDRLLVAHVTEADVGDLPARFPGIEFLTSPAGLPRQRNAILDAIGDCDAVLFLDDDFLPAPDYLAVTARILADHPGAVVTTGTVIADGANGPGIGVEAGRAMLGADRPPADPLAVAPHFNGYGCNMALRLKPMRDHALRFDENLPLYGWYEDLDLTRRLGAHGAILRLAGARGVHLGTKTGRVAQLRLGYSQVANAIYLARKGSYPWSHAIPSFLRHLAKNAVRSLNPEPWADRRGRLRGNLIALADLLRGRMHPLRVLDL